MYTDNYWTGIATERGACRVTTCDHLAEKFMGLVDA